MMEIAVTVRLDLAPALHDALARLLSGIVEQALAAEPDTASDKPIGAALAAELAPASAASPKLAVRWTPERKAALHSEFQAGRKPKELLVILNALPGLEISYTQLSGYMCSMGFRRRSPAAAPKALPLDPPEPGPQPPPVPARPVPARQAPKQPPLRVDRSFVAAWASERGLYNGGQPFDLDRINAKREELGLPTFVLPSGLRESAATMRPAVATVAP